MSPNATERLWNDTGYSLPVNHKKVDPANKNPPPPEVCVWQFEHVNHMREKLACRGNPILSGNAKKKQQVGNIKAPGTS